MLRPCHSKKAPECCTPECRESCKHVIGIIGWCVETQRYTSYNYNHSIKPHLRMQAVLILKKDCYTWYECDHQCEGCENVITLCTNPEQLREGILAANHNKFR
jgi:hypothetical protein